MVQDRIDKNVKENPASGTSRSASDWAKAGSRSPDDFPPDEATEEKGGEGRIDRAGAGGRAG